MLCPSLLCFCAFILLRLGFDFYHSFDLCQFAIGTNGNFYLFFSTFSQTSAGIDESVTNFW